MENHTALVPMMNERGLQDIWARNSTVPATAHKCVHDLIFERARSQLDAPAVNACDGNLTYQELIALSDRLGRHLSGVIRNDTIVPLCFEKSMWTIVTILAVLKAGGAFVLLDVAQPEARLKNIVQQTQTSVICSSVECRQLSTRLVEEKGNVIVVGPEFFDTEEKAEYELQASDPTSSCYVVFTSGSTGTPKGVVLSHASICTAFHYQLDALGFTPGSRVFDFASYSFDVAVHNALATLVAGACLCIPSENDRLQDPARSMVTMDVTIANLTPSVARLIDPCMVPSIQTLIFLGESLSRHEAQRWAKRCRIINTYGPAECTPISTINTASETLSENTNIGIGVGVGAVTWVVDADNHDILLQPGQVGELLLEGPLVGKGYLNDPEKTAHAFIQSPTWLLPIRQSRLYKTGDLVQYSEDGSLRFITRKDNQVKIHGQRVELGEVEHHIQSCFPSAAQTVVDLISSTKTSPLLAAFLQMNAYDEHKDGGSEGEQGLEIRVIVPDDEVLRDISNHLPGYMVPSVFFQLQDIPRTASGKTDRKRLRELGSLSYTKQAADTRTKRKPKTEMERKMQSLWAVVFEQDPEDIGLDDRFISLGGDSLTGIRLVAEARKAGVELRVVDIFKQPTLAGQAQAATSMRVANLILPYSLVDNSMDINEIAGFCNTQTSAIEDVYPCTPLQEGLFSLTMRRPGDYILQTTLRISDLSLDAVKIAWRTLLRAAPTLRTRIVHTRFGLLQVVLSEHINWEYAQDLQTYLKRDRSVPFEIGNSLSRYALVGDNPANPEWMVFTLHHSLYDAWSLDLMMDLFKKSCLENPTQRQRIQAAPQFNAFVGYVQATRKQGDSDEYWRKALDGAETIQFPQLRISQQPKTANKKLEWSCNVNHKRSRELDATLSTLIRAALAIVLARQTQSNDVSFGATVSGRNAPVPGIEDIIGPTIATVPVRVRLEKPEQTVSEFLKEMQNQATNMIPFEQTGLQHISRLGDSPKRACDFQTLLVVQPQEQVDKDTASIRWHMESEELNTYALTFECFPTPAGIRFIARYDPDCIDSWRLERLLSQWSFTLEQLADVTFANRQLRELDIVPNEERNLIWNWNSKVPEAVNKCIHELFREQVRLQPVDHQAVNSWDGTLTYRELDKYSDQLAQYLLEVGIEREVLVPLCFEKSLLTIVAMLAVLKAGGGFVPIDPSLPASRRQDILDETRARLVITSKQNYNLFVDSSYEVIPLSLDFIQTMKDGRSHEGAVPDVSSVAYVIFTSGTTGRPKGVVLEHRAVSSSCTAHGNTLGFNSNSRTLQFSSYTFDACIAEVFTTLIFGGVVCVPSDGDRLSNLGGAIEAMNINWVFLTPAVARLLDPASVPSVKTIAIGGEKFSSADAERWVQADRRVFLVYGPTECCIYCTGHDISEGIDSSLIGRSIGSVGWVVDAEDHNRLVPLGSIGELLVEGPILARGYLNDEQKTNLSFITDPLWLSEGNPGFEGRHGRLYKTGDLVEYTSAGDGTLRYVGRKDTQIKIRGQRLELAEVEHHVRQCTPNAKQVVAEVIAPGDKNATSKLVAFVQMTTDGIPNGKHSNGHIDYSINYFEVSPETILHIKQRLPGYMVPDMYFSIIGDIPRMVVSGKTDRKRLREVGSTLFTQHLQEIEKSFNKKRQPSTEEAFRLRSVWARVLNIFNESSIGLDDNFLQLGGDSIIAMKLVAEARKDNMVLTVADVFRAPTLEALSRLQSHTLEQSVEIVAPFSLLGHAIDVKELCEDIALSCGDGINSKNVKDAYPCTPLQEGLMSLASKHDGDYIMQNVLELTGDIRVDAFKAAWEETVRSIPTLQTRIVQHSELGLLQVVLQNDNVWIEKDINLQDYLKDDKVIPMNLGRPLSRFALLGDKSRPQFFVWTVHHALYDGWSLASVMESASHSYLGGRPTAEQQPFSAFVGYVEAQKGEQADNYWLTTLRDNEATPFPPLPPHIREAMADMSLEHDCDISVKRLDEGLLQITTSTLIRAALAIVIGRHTGSSEAVFGVTLSGRNAPVAKITEIVGPTIATVPLRIRLTTEEHKTARSFLHFVQHQAIDMIPYEQTGLQNIARLSKDTHGACQFQTLLVIQMEDDRIAHDQAFGTWRTKEQLGFTTYAITLECIPVSQGIRMKARFDSRVIDCWKVESMLGQLSHVIQQLSTAAAGSDQELGAINLLSSQDSLVLQRWNAAPPRPAIERCVHEMIKEQAQARLTKTAIFGWDGEFTFEQLDILSDRFGGYLASLGVGPEILVPLCFAKSSWTIVAMLSVMKAGGAFVLLDPTHPTDRLRALCEMTSTSIAIASPSTSDKISSFVENVVIVDQHLADRLPRSHAGLEGRASPMNTAYIIFTSGSTGAPKGCKIEHRSYCSAAVNHGSIMDMSPNTRSLQFGSYSFAGAIMEILMTLIHGGCVCVPSDEERSSRLEQAICQLDANWAFLTSSVLSSLSPDMVPCLRTICVGGEAVHAAQIKQWSNRVHLRQTYGSAETSAVVSSAHLTEHAKTSDVGRPTTGRYWIVDSSDINKLAPLGAIGEVIIEGPTIGREYLNQPEKSAAAFIQPPIWRHSFGDSENGFRFYKTGDLAAYTSSGAIQLFGRKDTQVKLRGQRIELGEIEHQARLATSWVSEIAVELAMPKGTDTNAAILVAFVVLRNTTEESSEANSEKAKSILPLVRERLQSILPQYMVPSVFLVMLEMPKTISKKTDRKRLREIASRYTRQELVKLGSLDDGIKRQPSTEKERRLQLLWSQVLGLEPQEIGLDDDFFQIGGDSVSALKLVAEARRIGFTLVMADIFKQRSLAAQAQIQASEDLERVIPPFSLLQIDAEYKAELRNELARSCDVNLSQIEDAYPCTPLQEGLLSLTFKNSGDYVLQNVLELSDDLHLEKFQSAWQQTISKVAALRTRIVQHKILGHLQVVVTESVNWQQSMEENLETYLTEDKHRNTELGMPLSRFVLVGKKATGPRWLVWTIHHALYDGWSLPLILNSVKDAYFNRPSLDRKDFNYFVRYIQEIDNNEANAYWGATLANYDSVPFPALPTMHKPTADKVVERICDLQPNGRSEATLSTIIRAALGLIISRHINSSDVVFGAVLSGRNAPVNEIEKVVGPTIATVPIRVQLSAEQQVSDYLEVIQRQEVDMIPVEQTGLQHISQLNKSACDFQTLLVIQPPEQETAPDDETFGTWLTDPEQHGFTTYALTLQCSLPTAAEGLRIQASFDSTVISSWHMNKILDQFEFVLQQLIDANPDKTVSEIDLLTPKDRSILWSANDTVVPTVSECVHDLIRTRIRMQPDATAISSWDGEMTYKELDIFSDSLAQHLISLGTANTGDIVPLCFEKSMWTVVAVLASMKAGFGSVTMDTTQPAERLRTIVQRVQPSLILSSVENEELASHIVSEQVVVVVGRDQLLQMKPSPGIQLPVVSPASTICVLFTSGSTGLPKGATIRHCNFATAIKHQAAVFGHGPGARIYAFASYSFDISWFDTVHGLASGSTLCIPSETERKDDLEGSLARSRSTVAFLTPSVARLLRPAALPNLRVLALGGEPQRWSDFSSWPDYVTKLSVYGPAECTVVSAVEDAHVLQKRDMTLPTELGLNTWLVDPSNDQLLSGIGTIGEIWLEGPLVGSGYFNDFKRSAASFVEDPLWLLQGSASNHRGRHGRLYKTGDLAKYNADGSMSFVGRKDNQVKIRGQRVELAEVEHHVRQVMREDAKQVVAEIITLAGDKTSAMLVAFVEKLDRNQTNGTNGIIKAKSTFDFQEQPNTNFMIVQPEVVDELLKRLPSYMVPRVYFKIDCIPRTVNGKTDRKRLREIGSRFSIQQLVDLETSSRERKRQPSTPTESVLQRLWAQVLNIKIDSVGVEDNFFRLGGDSIAAMKLVGLARQERIMTLTVADIFRLPSLQLQAEMHQQSTNLEHLNGSLQQIPPFTLLSSSIDTQALCKQFGDDIDGDLSVEDVYPCTPLQEGLFSLTLKHTGDYVMQRVLELADFSQIQLSAFKEAWQETVRSTGILRTRILQHGEIGLVQVLLKDVGIQWHQARDETLECYLKKDKTTPMDFGQPLVRFALVGENKKLGPRWFVWTVHHALYDGWSLPMITRSAAATYRHLMNASLGGRDPTLDEVSPKFNTFVQCVEQSKGEKCNNYWKSALAGIEAIQFPTVPASVAEPVADRALEKDCALSLRARQNNGVTKATLVKGALALLISRQTGIHEAIIGTTVSGRNAPVFGIDKIIGPTIATLPLRIKVPTEVSVSDYLIGLQQQATEMIPYEQSGLHIISKLSPDAQIACNFQTLLVMQPSPDVSEDETEPNQSEYGIWSTDSEQEGFTTYALTIECSPTAEGVKFRAIFDSKVIEPWKMERLLVQMSFLMQQLSEAPSNTNIANVVNLSPEDKQTIWMWNQNVPATIERCVHDIIQESIYEQPDSPAVCAWDGELAYGQLDEFSERLAHDLIEAGVTQGMIVPLCFEKSMWTVVGLLAVLKTGAAFTFLDAETQPEARLRTIVEQAHASVICSSVAQTNLSQRLGGKVIVVGPSLGLSRQQSRASTIMPRVDPSSPLYLVFTSGSTGQPKGAILPHKSFASALHYQLGPLNLTKHSRVYDFASYSFDVAVHNALATLAVGGCLCVPSDNDRKTRLAESIKEMEVNFANLTSSVSRLIEPHEVPTLATLTLGGEPVIQDDAERWWGKVKVINSCGPAECTPMSVINSFASSPAEVRWIGLGTGNLTWIVDPGDHNILLPVGQAGELMLEGPLIGYGYLNDTVKTAAAFVDDPTWLVAGAPGHPGRSGRLYKTGDLVRYNQDGSLQILGRKDTQVKVRGQRVELEEVEHHLRRFLPEAKIVAETVTIAETSSAILAAFFCLEAVSESQAQTSTHKNAAAVDQAAIKTISSLATRLGDEMSKCLPPYMVPSIYVPVAAMPMTATDKTDRKRLRALAASLSREQLDQMRGLLATSKRMPETELERQLQSLWARILKIPNDKIGLDDGFFRLGGDSITAMHLVGEARKLGILFSVADIFKEQSITKLIERQQFNGYKSEIVDTLPPPPAPFSLVDTPTKIGVISSLLSLSPKMQSTNISDIFPLTDFQTQSISRGIALPAVARNYFWLDFGASTVVNRERLRKSCHSLLNHYPLLRSVFVPFQKAFWQVVLWQCEVPLSEISVKADMDRACETICTKDLQSQVTAGTLPTSFILVRNQHHHYRLIIRLSHAQYDGVSLAVISQSLADFYHGRQVSATPDFSAYLAHLMNEHTRSGVYWKQHLSGSRNTQVASRISRGVVYEKVPRRIQAEGSNKLPQLADGVSVASLIGSAWAIVLSLITGQDDVMFGHLVADREAAVLGIQNIVGPCLNIIPIRIKILREQTNTTAILHSVHEQLLSLRQTGLMMGWEDIIKSCTDWPEGSTLESVVQHQNIDEHPKIQFGDTNTRLQWFDNPNLVPAALSIISYPEGSKLRVQILASSHMLTSETAGLLVACLCDTIDVLTRCQDKPIPASFLDNLQMAVRPLS